MHSKHVGHGPGEDAMRSMQVTVGLAAGRLGPQLLETQLVDARRWVLLDPVFDYASGVKIRTGIVRFVFV